MNNACKKIMREFYSNHPIIVAKNLLGCALCVRLSDNRVLRGIIVETEAYRQDEESCHAYCGITKRSKTLFMPEGTLYVYFTYGMHYCANIVTEPEGIGSAVLIRALEPLFTSDFRLCSGPAKLCKALGITKSFNEIDTCAQNSIVWVEKFYDIPDTDIVQTTRIGIKKATELPWRFYIKDNGSVSKK